MQVPRTRGSLATGQPKRLTESSILFNGYNNKPYKDIISIWLRTDQIKSRLRSPLLTILIWSSFSWILNGEP